jgi:hypothetical protein
MDIKSLIETWHPKLIGTDYKIIPTNYDLAKFNCIAYVMNVFDYWYGPSTEFWPHEILSRSSKLDNYIKYFELYNYKICDNFLYESDFDKIALYVDNNVCVKHAAKQYKDRWRSKLGANQIIEHDLDWLTGNDFSNYGKIGIIMKKKI